MIDELEFRGAASQAMNALKRHLDAREKEGDAGFEVQEQNGVLQISFQEQGGKFVISPNEPARQVWISALATSFKVEWDTAAQEFILPRTGEALIPLVERLVEECVQG